MKAYDPFYLSEIGKTAYMAVGNSYDFLKIYLFIHGPLLRFYFSLTP